MRICISLLTLLLASPVFARVLSPIKVAEIEAEVVKFNSSTALEYLKTVKLSERHRKFLENYLQKNKIKKLPAVKWQKNSLVFSSQPKLVIEPIDLSKELYLLNGYEVNLSTFKLPSERMKYLEKIIKKQLFTESASLWSLLLPKAHAGGKFDIPTLAATFDIAEGGFFGDSSDEIVDILQQVQKDNIAISELKTHLRCTANSADLVVNYKYNGIAYFMNVRADITKQESKVNLDEAGEYAGLMGAAMRAGLAGQGRPDFKAALTFWSPDSQDTLRSTYASNAETPVVDKPEKFNFSGAEFCHSKKKLKCVQKSNFASAKGAAMGQLNENFIKSTNGITEEQRKQLLYQAMNCCVNISCLQNLNSSDYGLGIRPAAAEDVPGSTAQ